MEPNRPHFRAGQSAGIQGLRGNGRPVYDSRAQKRELGWTREQQIKILYSDRQRFWSGSGPDPSACAEPPAKVMLHSFKSVQRELAIQRFFFFPSFVLCLCLGWCKMARIHISLRISLFQNPTFSLHSRGNKHLHFKVLLVKINEKQTFLWSLESALEKLRVEINMFYSSWKRHGCQSMWKTWHMVLLTTLRESHHILSLQSG